MSDPPRTSPAPEPAKRAEPVPRLHRQLPRHQYPLVSVLHATQGVGLDQISRDCTPNHYYAMNSKLSSSQYNNQQQFISNYFPVHKPKSRRIRSAQPSHITGDNLVKIALNPSQPDSRIPTIFVSNIRSIAPKIDELECVVNQNDSDIVCITETWLSDEIPDNAIAMHGFTLFRKDREKRGGGVAIFVKSNIQCKRLPVPDIPESVTEILWLQMRPCRLPRAVSSILIAVVYHPPHASADDNYKVYNHIQGVVDSHLACHPDSLICIVGDFNPNSTNISSSRFRQLCGLAQIVKVFTRDSGILTMAEKGHDCKHSPFFLPLHSSFFFLQNYTRRFFLQNYTRCFFRDDAIITRDVFSMQYYTRRFFNAIITRDVFSMQ